MDPSVDSSGHRLLIIDDDASIGAMIARVATRAGYQTLVVSTPDDFLQRVRIWAPTHIVMDLQMPVVDGLELLSQLASDHSTARIILISGAGDRVVDAARRVGTARGLSVTAALNKPFSIAELESVLQANRLEDPWLTVANLSAAIERDEFFLLYQPQVDLRSGAVRAAEALVRWRHPVRGVVSPLEFIPFAESSACIDRMTQWIVAAACAQLRRWDGMGVPMRLAINLSARNLHEARLGDQLEAQCRGAGVDPSRLTFELTETAAMRDATLMTDVLTRLRVKGFGLSIDDFGTGYSSLVLLHRLPFTELKVDRTFVASCATSKESRAIVRLVVELAHALDLQAVAEGVESADVMRLLRELNCDAAQGTFVALPLEADRIPAMVSGHADAPWYRAGAPWAGVAG
jgi:EAL domain-containing protein (putative c-di-GMP-specific phosphodiesterase class I)/ActR/RegA family two-component response regulator